MQTSFVVPAGPEALGAESLPAARHAPQTFPNNPTYCRAATARFGPTARRRSHQPEAAFPRRHQRIPPPRHDANVLCGMRRSMWDAFGGFRSPPYFSVPPGWSRPTLNIRSLVGCQIGRTAMHLSLCIDIHATQHSAKSPH